MKFSDEEILFLISFLDNKLTYLEREYIHDKKRISAIYDEDNSLHLNNSLLLKKRKIDMCLNILGTLKKELEK